NSGFSTDLVFSNSCQSSKSAENRLNSNIMNYFAGSFLMSGIKCFIGTNWETPDNKNTLDFTIRFYTSLFSDKSVGEALFISKEFARRNYDTSDLTWANYSLHGTPNYTILNDGGTEKSAQKIINPSLIFNFYPTPIAKSYNEFIQKEKEERDLPVRMSTLIYSFEEFSKILGAIIFSDHKFHAMCRDLPENPDDAIELKDWWNLIYACLWDFKKMEISPLVASFTDVLHANREVLQKIIGWVELFNSDMIDPGTMEGYLVTYQYYYENLLMELGEFESTDVFLISENSNNHYFFKGMKPSVSLITAPMIKQDYVGNQIEKYRGKLVVFNQNRKTLIPLITGSMIDNTVTGELELWFPGFLTSRIIKMPSA
ncbi:MAG: CHAT domain-containing protein, partial [Leptospira sp.]|nr:CHAT domain-containing protein [Leptospira sp.]